MDCYNAAANFGLSRNRWLQVLLLNICLQERLSGSSPPSILVFGLPFREQWPVQTACNDVPLARFLVVAGRAFSHVRGADSVSLSDLCLATRRFDGRVGCPMDRLFCCGMTSAVGEGQASGRFLRGAFGFAPHVSQW